MASMYVVAFACVLFYCICRWSCVYVMSLSFIVIVYVIATRRRAGFGQGGFPDSEDRARGLFFVWGGNTICAGEVPALMTKGHSEDTICSIISLSLVRPRDIINDILI